MNNVCLVNKLRIPGQNSVVILPITSFRVGRNAFLAYYLGFSHLSPANNDRFLCLLSENIVCRLIVTCKNTTVSN